MKRIRSFGVLSFGKYLAVFYAFLGFIFGPIFYGLLGFIFGIIATAFANLALKLTGGLEVELED
ncbi:MAG TPA: hypothetical protein VEU33_45040 [Archangium sp.]|nr:hypothetical protein [Archangium sp.]